MSVAYTSHRRAFLSSLRGQIRGAFLTHSSRPKMLLRPLPALALPKSFSNSGAEMSLRRGFELRLMLVRIVARSFLSAFHCVVRGCDRLSVPFRRQSSTCRWTRRPDSSRRLRGQCANRRKVAHRVLRCQTCLNRAQRTLATCPREAGGHVGLVRCAVNLVTWRRRYGRVLSRLKRTSR